MNFERFVNDPPQTPYAPTWDFKKKIFKKLNYIKI